MKCKDISSEGSYNSLKFMNSIHKNKKLIKFKSIFNRKDVFVRYSPNYKSNQTIINKDNCVIQLNDSGCNVVTFAHELTHVKQAIICGLTLSTTGMRKLMKLHISYSKLCKIIYDCDEVLTKYYKNIHSLEYQKLKFNFIDILNSFTVGKYATNCQHESHNEEYFKRRDECIPLFEINADYNAIITLLGVDKVYSIFKEFKLINIYNRLLKIDREFTKYDATK